MMECAHYECVSYTFNYIRAEGWNGNIKAFPPPD